MDNEVKIEIDVDDSKLRELNFTPHGISRFNEGLSVIAEKLIEKSVAYANIENERDVTEKHVRQAIAVTTVSLIQPKKPAWLTFCQIGEYVCTGIVGAGASNLDKSIGIFAFGLGIAIAVVLFTFRIVKSN